MCKDCDEDEDLGSGNRTYRTRGMEPTPEQRDKATEIAKAHDDQALAAAIRLNVEQLNLHLLAAAERKLDVELLVGNWKRAHRVGEPTPRIITTGKIIKEL